MSNFSILSEEADGKDLWVTDYDAIEFLDFECNSGESLAAEGSVATLVVDDDSKRQTPILVGIHPFLVVSDMLRKIILETDSEHVQFFPVDVVYCDEPIDSEPYWYMNVLSNVECLDMEKSDLEISEFSGIPLEVFKLFLQEKPIKDRHLVRMEEFPTLLLVSKKLRKKLEKAGLPSRHFTEVEDYTSDGF